jgi:hypothetical protein
VTLGDVRQANYAAAEAETAVCSLARTLSANVVTAEGRFGEDTREHFKTPGHGPRAQFLGLPEGFETTSNFACEGQACKKAFVTYVIWCV